MSKLEALRATDPSHAEYVDNLITEVRQRPYGASLAGEVSFLIARGIVSQSGIEADILRETFPGQPTSAERDFIALMWGAK